MHNKLARVIVALQVFMLTAGAASAGQNVIGGIDRITGPMAAPPTVSNQTLTEPVFNACLSNPVCSHEAISRATTMSEQVIIVPMLPQPFGNKLRFNW